MTFLKNDHLNLILSHFFISLLIIKIIINYLPLQKLIIKFIKIKNHLINNLIYKIYQVLCYFEISFFFKKDIMMIYFNFLTFFFYFRRYSTFRDLETQIWQGELKISKINKINLA